MKHISIMAIGILLLAGCSVNKAKIDNELKPYFDKKGVDGCFTMLNNADGSITVYNIGMDTMRVAPLSTFDIMGSLVALHTGAATSEKMILPLDGMVCNGTDTCTSCSLADAFRSDCHVYFQELAKKTGKEKMSYWIDSIGYGNKMCQGPVDSFWFNNTIKISADEQLGLMKRLYFDQLPFRKTVQETVRQMMLQEDNTAYRLFYRTGNGVDEKNHPISWACGWIEENRHVYFFATLLRSDKTGMLPEEEATGITRDILSHYGFFKGNK